MIRTTRFLKRSGLSLIHRASFSASLKRFKQGEIPDVLKYDRPYGFFFLKATFTLFFNRNRDPP